ncbi:hypothetical protein HPB48_021342 [Haemaphysalis longicornis]|uniref:Uncharacterized protein n=1 Tax=Haemaphysalis longicornis TaxID=44386 RepID=A0A9J6GGP0_HAELO|nr:hypothetical protein HPB48_021342 [Haemaphysalis longicornis]
MIRRQKKKACDTNKSQVLHLSPSHSKMKCAKIESNDDSLEPRLTERRTRQLHQAVTAKLMYPQLHLNAPVLRRAVQTVGKARKGQLRSRKRNFTLVKVIYSRCNIFLNQMCAIYKQSEQLEGKSWKKKKENRCADRRAERKERQQHRKEG